MDMTRPEFDVLAVARDLESSGIEKRQAKAVAVAGRANLSASEDIRRLEEKLEEKIDNCATKANLAELHGEFYRLLWGRTGVIASTRAAAAGAVAAAGRRRRMGGQPGR